MPIDKVKKRDGSVVDFDKSRIVSVLSLAFQSIGEQAGENAERLANAVEARLTEAFKGKAMPSVEDVQDNVEAVLIGEGHAAVAKAYILYRKKREELREKKQDVLGGNVDESNLSLNALLLAKARYLHTSKDGKAESPVEMYKRVAKLVAEQEKKYKKSSEDIQQLEQSFFGLISQQKFIPSGRIFAGAGTKHSQLYSSFVIPIEDSMEGIFTALLEKAVIQSQGGGTGFSFSELRQKGVISKKSNAYTSGPVAFIELFNHASKLTVQRGNRPGANMGSLHISHPDIIEFITAKDSRQLENFNISVEVTDAFMEAVEKNQMFDLMDPKTKEKVKSLKARQIFDIMVYMAWKIGDPGILFIDAINKDNPLPKLGPIVTTDPCGDQPMMAYDACPIGAINIAKFGAGEDVDYKALKQTVEIAVQFLDNIIDASKFPLKKIEQMALANRRIGIGVLGWADLLYRLQIPYNSEKALELAEKIASAMKESAVKATQALAREKEQFPNFDKSIFKTPRRNAGLLTIAPTGSRSILADTSAAIEPHFALAYTRKVSGNEMIYINPVFKEYIKEKNLNADYLEKEALKHGSIQHLEDIPERMKQIFVTAHDINARWHIRMQAAWQKHIDNAISKTINFKEDATLQDIESAILFAWKSGCKGVTVYRDKSREGQIINFG